MRRILLLLALFSISSATCSLNLTDPYFVSAYNSAMILVVAALMFSVVLASLAYMVGEFTKSPNLLVFSKDSLVQLFITVLLIVVMFSLLEGTCQFMSLFIGESTDPLNSAILYSSSLKNEGRVLVTSLYKDSISEKFSGAQLQGYFAPFVGGETAFQSSYHNAFAREDEILIDLINVGYVSAGVQYFFLQSVRDFVFPILIPFGLLLRALPFLREAGNTILAIGFTLLVILPFAYAVNASAAETAEVSEGGYLSTAGSYILQTIFLPNLAIVVTVTAAGAMIKAIKVLP